MREDGADNAADSTSQDNGKSPSVGLKLMTKEFCD